MIYMSPNALPIQRKNRYFGHIMTPAGGKKTPIQLPWCADNEVFTERFRWPVFADWLAYMHRHRETCKFVVVPDVVGNACATLDRYRWYAWRIKSMGFPVAFVAQDGIEDMKWPPEYDVLFIGGSTEWKMGEAAAWCIKKAQAAGKWVHVGRVNSQKRIRHFQLLQVDSVDGTGLVFAPDKNYRVLMGQLVKTPLIYA